MKNEKYKLVFSSMAITRKAYLVFFIFHLLSFRVLWLENVTAITQHQTPNTYHPQIPSAKLQQFSPKTTK